MKNPQLLITLMEKLNTMAWCNDLNIRFTIDTFDGRELTRAFDMVQDDKFKLEDNLATIIANPNDYDNADYNEAVFDIRINSEMFTDLCLLQELMVDDDVNYASPKNLPKSIKIVSELLVKQLECKTELNEFYDKYYCDQLTSVLAELCKEV